MAEQRLTGPAGQLAARFLEVADELEPYIAEDSDGTSVEWWLDVAAIAHRMGDAAQRVAVAIAREEPARG